MDRMFCERPDSGFFCAVEGIDGSGKSTLAEEVSRKLPGSLHLVEPTGFESGKKIRRALKSGALSRQQFTELFFEDRKNNVEQRILPALQTGRTIIQDRYYYSTAAYQSTGPAEAQSVLEKSESQFPKPDLVLYLDIPVAEALERIRSRNRELEVFEKKSELNRIRENYEAVLPASAVRLDATLKPETLVQKALENISQRLRES